MSVGCVHYKMAGCVSRLPRRDSRAMRNASRYYPYKRIALLRVRLHNIMSRTRSTVMRAAIRQGELPPFHLLDEYDFQGLCRDLLDVEPEIATCEVYGKRGEPQDGIDLLAHRKGVDGIEVGQCKCYEDFPPAKIEAASEEFFNHWERWQNEDVRRFILFVTSDLQYRQRQDKILEQEKRFREHKITYEVWSPATIRKKLQPHQAIVTRYFPNAEYWVRDICGVVPPPLPSADTRGGHAIGAPSATDVTQMEQLITLVSGQTARHLDDIRTAWLEGKKSEARDGLRHLRDEAVLWVALPADVKARTLRLEASLDMDSGGDVAHARRLADDAQALAPSDGNLRLHALIAYKEGDLDAALRLLDGKEDADSVNLRCGLLLEAGRVDDCRGILMGEDVGEQVNAETLRLRALVHLADGDIDWAQLAMGRALELAPRWVSNRYTAAVVDYWSAVSPAMQPDRIGAWPEPVDWAFVKRDDESLTRLRRAAATFDDLVRETDGEERRATQAWRLACLANDPVQLEEASAYCADLLAVDPADFRAIAWAVARNYDIDRKAIETALRRLIFRGKASPSHILALVISYIADRKASKALTLLDDTHPIFEEHGEHALWTSWYAQASVAAGAVAEALQALEGAARQEDMRYVRTLVLRAQARDTKDWSPLVRHLEDSFEETGDVLFLFECCATMYRLGDWTYVADRADLVIDGCATEAALRIVASAAYHGGRYDLCLRLLDGHLHLFAGQKLPPDLRRLKVAALREQGVLVEAVTVAETLAREEPTTENILALMQIYADKGDLAGLALVARQLDGRTDVAPAQGLRVVSLIVQDAPGLASSLWRQIVGRPHLPDEAAIAVFELGLRLGLDAEAAPLFERVRGLADRGQAGARTMTIDDVISLLRQRREREAELNDLYRRGGAPIHILAAQLNLPLADIYHQRLADNEAAPDPVRQFALFARHGGRAPVPDVANDAQWRLHMDVTALLLAAHLEVLAAVERVYKPLHIPPDLMPALLEMRARVTPHQLSKLRGYRQIVDLAERGTIRVVDDAIQPRPEEDTLVAELGVPWAALYRCAREDGGYIVDYLPLQKLDRTGPPTALQEDCARRVINCRTLVEAIWEHGAISDKARDEALRVLGVEGQAPMGETRPEPRAAVYCSGNTAETLSDAELLVTMADRFTMHIGASELARARAERAGSERARALADWLVEIVDKVRQGIADGTYVVMPRDADVGADTVTGVDTPEVQCISALLRLPARQGDVVWMDDRFMNGYVQQERGASIVGIGEILKGLRGVGELAHDDYYDTISRLRAANVRYIPVEADEILHHLRLARVSDGTLVEHRGLATVRRYVAACLVHARDLQRPLPTGRAPEQAGEDAFLHSLSRAISDALEQLWALDDDGEVCRARAEWVLNSLYLDDVSWQRVILVSPPERADMYAAAGGFLTLLAHGLPIDRQARPEAASARQRYKDWLYDRLLGPRFESEPTLAVAMADMVKNVLLLIREDALRDNPVAVVVKTLQTLHEELPPPIKAELERDHGFVAQLGYEFRERVSVGGLDFEPDAFWVAARDAINGHGAPIVPDNVAAPVTFKRVDDRPGQDAIFFQDPTTGHRVDVAIDDLGLMRDSVTEREALLRQHREWFDGPDEVVDRAIAEIATTEDPKERIDKVAAGRRVSVTMYYGLLPYRLSQQKALPVADLLPPSVEGLLRHLRLDARIGAGAAFTQAVDEAARTLRRDEGIAIAIERSVSLPVPLPVSVTDAIGRLTPGEGRELVKRLLRMHGSPLSQIHLVGILQRRIDDTPAYQRLASRLVTKLVGDRGRIQVAAYVSLLRWVDDHMARRTDVQALAPHVRLAVVWVHAHRLFAAYAAAGAPAQWVAATFGSPTWQAMYAPFDRTPDYWVDCAHPERVDPERFLVAGLVEATGTGTSDLVSKAMAAFALAYESHATETRPTILSHPSLVVDVTRARNSLDSFLGGNLVDTLGFQSGDGAVTSAALGALVRQGVDSLTVARDDANAWQILHTVLDDLPLYEDLADRFKAILLGTDFTQLLRERSPGALTALLVATLQIVNYDDEALRDRLRDQAVQVAAYLAEREASVWSGVNSRDDVNRERQAIGRILLTLAQNLGVGARVPGGGFAVFIDLVARLIETCDALIPIYRPVVHNLWENLPLSVAQDFTLLLVRMRTLGHAPGT